MLLEILKQYNSQDDGYIQKNKNRVVEIAKALASVDPFDLACEFMMDDEKQILSDFVKKCKSTDCDVSEVSKKYGKYI